MKTDRLIGILSVLLQKEKCTIPFLAEQFEVSRRTVSRDIETLCRAGIPVCTLSGQNGGVSIMDGYTIDRTLLTESDMQSILAGLKSLDSISSTGRYRQLMGKLAPDGGTGTDNALRIDLTSWYREKQLPKITMLLEAINSCRMVSFTYYAPGKETDRTVEPYELVFQWSSWYLRAFCTTRQAFRLFKLNRMQQVCDTGHQFNPRQVPADTTDGRSLYPETIRAAITFKAEAKWRLIDYYGPDCFSESEDGTLRFLSGFADKASLFSFLLSFGDSAELTAPPDLRNEFRTILKKMTALYET